MKKIICLILCLLFALSFVSCKNIASKKAGDNTAQNTSSSAQGAEGKTEGSSVSTTTPMPTTKKRDAVSISSDDALTRLSEFYGAAYKVSEKEQKDGILYLEAHDINGNLYSEIEVELDTANVKETIVHSGEVNEFNLLV